MKDSRDVLESLKTLEQFIAWLEARNDGAAFRRAGTSALRTGHIEGELAVAGMLRAWASIRCRPGSESWDDAVTEEFVRAPAQASILAASLQRRLSSSAADDSWPTQHESDCLLFNPRVQLCSCPTGNL